MKPTYLIPFLVIALSGYAQTTSTDKNGKVEQVTTEAPAENTVYKTTGLQIQPEFPGGNEAFYKFVSNNFNAPTADDGPITVKAYVSFIVEKDGTVTGIKALKDPGYGIIDEATRVLKSSPKWKPGIQNNKPVRAQFTLPLILNLPAPAKSKNKNRH